MLGRLFRKRERRMFSARLMPVEVSLEVASNQRLLDAALEQGIAFPHSCRVGGCGTCRCRLLEGEVKEHTDTSYLLSADEIAEGTILACQSTPRGDVVIEVPGLTLEESVGPQVACTGRVSAIDRLGRDVIRLELELEQDVDYRAGQFAQLSVPGIVNQPRSYSFSTGPDERRSERSVAFDIRVLPDGVFSGWLGGSAAVGDKVDYEGPRGSFYLRPSGAPILGVVGGTGLGPLLAMIEELVGRSQSRDAILLVGARSPEAFYGLDILETLQRRFPARLDVWPVVSEADSEWSGRRGLVTEHIAGVPRLHEHHAYLCGPPGMIDAAVPILTAAGVSNIHYDKFLDTSGL